MIAYVWTPEAQSHLDGIYQYINHAARNRVRLVLLRYNAPAVERFVSTAARSSNAGKYPSQSVLVVGFDGYVYLVPYVEEPDYYFLKTVIPSRKATRDYLLRGDAR